jgi:hypothetical protein
MDSSYVFEMRVYDPVKGTWERLPPINDPHFAGIGGLVGVFIIFSPP